MTTDARVIVVGAGPAGCATAIRLLRRGIGPVLLVDRSRFPRVKACAGGISARSARCLADLGLLEEVERRAYRITGAVIENQSGKRMRFSGGGGALVMPRDRLDALLAEAAESEGARFVQGVHVDSVRRMQDGGLALEVKGGGALTCSRLVVATGASARLAGTPVPDRTLVTMTGWYRDLPFEPGTLEMFFSKELAPHYGWLFPLGRLWRKRPVYSTVSFLFHVGLILVPLFLMLRNWRIDALEFSFMDSRFGLILIYTALSLPFTIFLLTGFFRSLPTELAEAAAIDGCGELATFSRVYFPLAAPGLTTAAIFNFIGIWNEYNFALVFITNPDLKTLPVGLYYLVVTQQYAAEWPALFAGIVILFVPTFLIFLLLKETVFSPLIILEHLQ